MYIYIHIYIYIYIHISELVSTVAVFKRIYSHLKNISCYRRFYLLSYVSRYVIMPPLSS